MACITLLAAPATMATTQLNSVRHEVFAPVQAEQKIGRHIPRMNWVVVTDNKGVQHLRMRWTANRS